MDSGGEIGLLGTSCFSWMHSEKSWRSLPGVFNSLSIDVRAVHILPRQPQWLLFLRGEMRQQLTHCSTPTVPGAPARKSGGCSSKSGSRLSLGDWSWDGCCWWSRAEVGLHSSTPSSQQPFLPEHEELAFKKRKPFQSLLKRLQSVNKQIAHLITLMMLSLSYCYCQYKGKKGEKIKKSPGLAKPRLQTSEGHDPL